MATITVKAKKLRPQEGDFVTGLDNAFVVEVERAGYEDSEVTILMHDAQGDEVTLTCWKNMPITIDRKA